MNPNLSEGLDGNVTDGILADLRGMVWQQVGPNGDFADLAARAGVASATIDRFMYQRPNRNQTKRPQLETVARLLKALDRLNLLEQAFRGDHERIGPGRKKPNKQKKKR